MAATTAEPEAQVVVENDSSSTLVSGTNVGNDLPEDAAAAKRSAELRDIETYVYVSVDWLYSH